MGYPKVLSVAIAKAYAPRKVHTTEFCYKTIKGKVYVLVAVSYVRSGKASTLALQFVNAAGWFATWKDGKALPAVPKRQRAHVRAVVKNLRAQCA
jgi:hypothetical protein